MAPISSFLMALAMPILSMAAAVPVEPEIITQIVGGTAASAGEFPYIVSLQLSGSHFCGGSLLAGNIVITAAHCAEGMTASRLTVRAGSLRWASGGTTARVSSIEIHPSWNTRTLDYDVAILTLATSIPESSTVGYASLPASGNDPSSGSTTTVAGWGYTREGGSLSATLQKVDVPVVSRSQCRSVYGTSSVTDRMWCAGTTAGGKDSCQGDSGGPIVDASGTLVGLVSWGSGCARAGVPGVYARVGSFTSFITSAM